MFINHLKAQYNILELEIDLDDSILDGKDKEVVFNKNYVTVSIDHVDVPIEDINNNTTFFFEECIYIIFMHISTVLFYQIFHPFYSYHEY